MKCCTWWWCYRYWRQRTRFQAQSHVDICSQPLGILAHQCGNICKGVILKIIGEDVGTCWDLACIQRCIILSHQGKRKSALCTTPQEKTVTVVRFHSVSMHYQANYTADRGMHMLK